MTMLLLSIGAALSLLATAFFSGTETGTYSLSRVRLRVETERGRRDAVRLSRLMERPEDLVITTILGNNVVDYCLTVCVTALLLELAAPEGLAETYATLLLTPLILVFGGIIPKAWFQRQADRLMYPLALPLQLCKGAMQVTGLIWVLGHGSRALMRRINPDREDLEEALLPRTRIVRLLHEGAARGGLSLFQRTLIERILNVSTVRVSNVMVPRQRAAIASIDLGREDFLRIARMAHFSRIPVYRRDPRRIVGIVNVYDVLTDEQKRPIASYAREPVFLTGDESVAVALLRLQQIRQVMAIVQDRQGNCVGVLTVKDLVEEIVGELEVW